MDLKSKKELTKALSILISSLTKDEKKEIIHELLKAKKEGIPISAFKARLSALEIITKYLREEEGKTFDEISRILNRKKSTLYNTYNNSRTKFKESLDVSDDSVTIPADIFADRRYSVLESIAAYLKDEKKLPLNKISSLLNKNYNTIKTVYRRYKIKR
ncbi:hypothetical protein KY366_04505 [Candidatus Woesearchaeota archaeon]|nr:hypothetical protein [Candidatus Woesearchaeota archaeon]